MTPAEQIQQAWEAATHDPIGDERDDSPDDHFFRVAEREWPAVWQSLAAVTKERDEARAIHEADKSAWGMAVDDALALADERRAERDAARNERDALRSIVDWVKSELPTRWSFSDDQRHTHTWHTREDFLEALAAKEPNP